MSKYILLLFALHLATQLRAQDTPPLTHFPKPIASKLDSIQKVFSAKPTVAEITAALQSCGKAAAEPVRIVHELAERGTGLLSILAQMLTPDTLWSFPRRTDSTSVIISVPLSNRVLLLYALASMGGIDAFAIIETIGATHKDPELRAASLNLLSTSLLGRVRLGELKPDKGVMQLFVNSLDDSTHVPSLGRTVATIARDGMKNWMNIDFGPQIQGVESIIVGREKRVVSLSQYRQEWWAQIEPKLTWDESLGTFKISN